MRLVAVGLAIWVAVSGVSACDYVKKSVATPPIPWVSPAIVADQRAYLEQRWPEVAQSLTMVRFDQVQLPPALFEPVYARLGTASLTRLLTQYVGKAMQGRLNDPVYQKRRIQDIRDDRKVTFAQTKGKATSYTQDELDVLMQAAYIMIPKISRIETSYSQAPPKAGSATELIAMGVASRLTKSKSPKGMNSVHRKMTIDVHWVQVIIDGTGRLRMKPVATIRKTATGRALRTDKNWKTAIQQADTLALKSTVKRIATETKKIDGFTIQSRVSEVDGREYTIEFGQDLGVGLDDWFILKEWVEDDAGKVTQETVGALRITNPDLAPGKAIGYQHLGQAQLPGGSVVESPRAGLQVGLAMTHQTGLNLRHDRLLSYVDTAGNTQHIPIYNEDVTSMTGFQLDIDANLAKATGIPQFFVGLELGMAYPNADRNSAESAFPVFYSAHLTTNKKWWWRNHGLDVQAGLGYDIFQVWNLDAIDGAYTMTSTSLTLGLGYEWMWCSRWSLDVDAIYKLGLGIAEISYKTDGTSNTLGAAEADRLYNGNYDISGIQFRLGVSYQF